MHASATDVLRGRPEPNSVSQCASTAGNVSALTPVSRVAVPNNGSTHCRRAAIWHASLLAVLPHVGVRISIFGRLGSFGSHEMDRLCLMVLASGRLLYSLSLEVRRMRTYWNVCPAYPKRSGAILHIHCAVTGGSRNKTTPCSSMSTTPKSPGETYSTPSA